MLWFDFRIGGSGSNVGQGAQICRWHVVVITNRWKNTDGGCLPPPLSPPVNHWRHAAASQTCLAATHGDRLRPKRQKKVQPRAKTHHAVDADRPGSIFRVRICPENSSRASLQLIQANHFLPLYDTFLASRQLLSGRDRSRRFTFPHRV